MKSGNAVSLLTERSKRRALIKIDLFSLRMQLDRAVSTLALHRTHVCVRAPAQPECLQNTWIRYHHRVTHTRSHAGVHLLQFVYVHQGRFNHDVLASTCWYLDVHINVYTETFLPRIQIIRVMCEKCLFIKSLNILLIFFWKIEIF